MLPVLEKIVLENRTEAIANNEKKFESGLQKVVDLVIPSRLSEVVTAIMPNWSVSYINIVSCDRNVSKTVYLLRFTNENKFLNFVISFNRRTNEEKVLFCFDKLTSIAVSGDESYILASTEEGTLVLFSEIADENEVDILGNNKLFTKAEKKTLRVSLPVARVDRLLNNRVRLLQAVKLNNDDSFFVAGDSSGNLVLAQLDKNEIRIIKTLAIGGLASSSVSLMKVIKQNESLVEIVAITNNTLVEISLDTVGEKISLISYSNADQISAFDVSEDGLAILVDRHNTIE